MFLFLSDPVENINFTRRETVWSKELNDLSLLDMDASANFSFLNWFDSCGKLNILAVIFTQNPKLGRVDRTGRCLLSQNKWKLYQFK